MAGNREELMPARGLRSSARVTAAARVRACALASLVSIATVIGFAPDAEASLVVSKPDGDVHVASARFAHSSNGARTVVWEQLVLDVARGEIAWIVAVPPGGWIEEGAPTWFEALDATTAPEVSPARSLGCSDPPPREDTAEAASSTAPRLIDAPIGGLASGADTIVALQSAGFLVDAATAARLRDFDASGEKVLVLHLPAGAKGPTPVLRVVSPSARAFPLALAPIQGTIPTRLRGWAFAPVRVRLDTPTSIEPAFEKLVWDGDRSNYSTLLGEARALAPDGLVVNYASRDGIFADEATGTTGVMLPALVRHYFGAIDAGSNDAWSCVRRAEGYGAKATAVAPWCGKSASWASTGVTPDCPGAPPGAIPSSELGCNGLDDLAAAMGGQVPASTWLTRFELGAVSPRGYSVLDAKLGTLPSFHEAKSLGAAGCTSGTTIPTDPGTPTTPDSGTGTDLPGPPGPSTEQVVDDSCQVGQAFADGCSRSSSSDSCGGDSSSSSSCGGDSSSSSSSCGGDSSSSSSGCGGGSGSDSGCSGGGSSGDSGCGSGGGSSGCSGGGGDSGCRVAGARRVKVTGGAYVLLGVLAIARRRGRKSRR
jgi:hypothetical protein